MIRKLLKYFACRSHNVLTQYRLACLYGLLGCFGWRGTFAIYIKIGKHIAAEQEKAKRKVKLKPESAPFVTDLPKDGTVNGI